MSVELIKDNRIYEAFHSLNPDALDTAIMWAESTGLEAENAVNAGKTLMDSLTENGETINTWLVRSAAVPDRIRPVHPADMAAFFDPVNGDEATEFRERAERLAAETFRADFQKQVSGMIAELNEIADEAVKMSGKAVIEKVLMRFHQIFLDNQ